MGQFVPPPGTVRPQPSSSGTGAASRSARQQEQMLAKLQPLLGRVMEPGERVLTAARACAPYGVLEFLTTGWIIVVVKRCVLVFTDRRILHVPTTRGYASRESVAEIRYGDIATMSFSLFGGVKLVYRDGRKETFSGIPRKELKVIRERISPLAGAGTMTPLAGRHHICPRCRVALQADRWECPGCGLEFKSRARAHRLSLLAPGGGYFYTRHPILGFVDAIVETYLLVFLLMAFALAFGGDTPEDTAAGWAMLVFAGIFLAIEKVITIYHADHYVREFLPVDMRFGRAPALAGAAP
ncbi:MAG TPA: hypothetical protein VGF40_05030 [Thermoanaerobaculia bacterium]